MPPEPTTPVVETSNLSRRFGARWAFARVSLTVSPGERVLLLGANGSGKTTLLRVLSTVLGANEGDLRLFGHDPRREPEVVRSRLALLSHSVGFYEDLGALDNLRVFGELLGLRAHRGAPLGREALCETLVQVGLDPQRADPIRAFSAGMRKRLQIAAVLLKRPDLVLLDEPFAALDPTGMDQMAALIRGLPGAVIIASHQVERASALCDRGLLLDKGLPRWQGPARDAWAAWKAVHETSPS